MAFNPVTGLVYYPGQETSSVFASEEKFEFKEGQWNLGFAAAPARFRRRRLPIRRRRQRAAFRRVGSRREPAGSRIPFQPSGGALSSAGQLIFVGNSTGKLFALDPVTGKTLWESQLGAGGVATPISYELDGKRFIAVMAGIKGRVYSFALEAKRA